MGFELCDFVFVVQCEFDVIEFFEELLFSVIVDIDFGLDVVDDCYLCFEVDCYGNFGILFDFGLDLFEIFF